MTVFWETFFWICLACVGYTYVGYPLLVGLRSWWRPAPVRRGPFQGSFAIILAARNEEGSLGRRLEELCRHIRASGLEGEIVVVSDGSTDKTADLARTYQETGLVQVVELPENVGKAAALTMGCQSARKEILVFADARQTWAEDALGRLLENFADPQVGAVSGDLVLQTGTGVLAGVGLYWRFEKWLRKKESLIHAQVGVTGAISAVRRALFCPIPQGTLLDDVYWPLQVAMQGYRVIHDERAVAYDRLPDKSRDEFRRKVRTLCGNYQLAARLPASLLPWRNPVWLAWISHKLLRLAVPWALLGMIVSCMLILGPIFTWALALQITCYALALVGLVPSVGKRGRLLGAAASFLVLNVAAWLAFWVWLTRRAEKSWRQITYNLPLENNLGQAAQPVTATFPVGAGEPGK